MTPRRYALAALGALIGWQIAAFEPSALPSILLAVAAAVVLLVVEETRVHEARRDTDYANRHVCHHGGSSWSPHEGDELERGRK